MEEHILFGRDRDLMEIPSKGWKHFIDDAPERSKEFHPDITLEHLQVRNYAIETLALTGEALQPSTIERAFNKSKKRVEKILDDLQRNLVFIARDNQGAVTWAHPVTVEPTPHRLHLPGGKAFFASCATAVMEVPYVLGKILQRPTQVEVQTACWHCEQPLSLEIDHRFNYHVNTIGADPLVFEPQVDIDPRTFTEDTIIDAY